MAEEEVGQERVRSQKPKKKSIFWKKKDQSDNRAVVKLNNKYNPRVFLEINNGDKIVIHLI